MAGLVWDGLGWRTQTNRETHEQREGDIKAQKLLLPKTHRFHKFLSIEGVIGFVSTNK